MMRTKEGQVKDKVVAVLKKLRVYYFFPVANGYGKSAIPDIIGCMNGIFVAIECKADDKDATAIQHRELGRIRTAGGCALVINAMNVDKLEGYLCEYYR
jgi:Holliday junction resolvase